MSFEQNDNNDLEFQAIKEIFDKYSLTKAENEDSDINTESESYYDDDGLLYKVSLKENVIEIKKWDKEGNLIQLGYHNEKAELEGETLIKENRRIIKENYKDNKKNGICKIWRDGKLIINSCYKDDKLDGEYKSWYLGGEVLSTHCYYKDGKFDGLFKYWYSDGSPYGEIYYKDGKFDGECKEWWSNGNLKFQRYYKDGILQGLSKEWDSKGNLLSDLV